MSEQKTKVILQKYNKKDLFSVWNVDEENNVIGEFPAVSFGIKKAELILKHLDELKLYVENNNDK